MNQDVVLRLLDEERRCLARDGDVLEVLPCVTRQRPNSGAYHLIAYSSLTDDNADEVIAAEIKHYRRMGAGFEWKLYSHDTPPDLLQRLERRGFKIGAREAVVVYDLNELPDWMDASGDHRVVRIEGPEQLADYARVAEEVFARDAGLITADLTQAIRAAPSQSSQLRGYVAYCGAEPVSIGRLYTHPRSAFGGLYGGGTRERFRGRGFYRALVAARARDAASLGARFLLVDALPTSRPILERMGFEWLTDTWPCEYPPATSNGPG